MQTPRDFRVSDDVAMGERLLCGRHYRRDKPRIRREYLRDIRPVTPPAARGSKDTLFRGNTMTDGRPTYKTGTRLSKDGPIYEEGNSSPNPRRGQSDEFLSVMSNSPKRSVTDGKKAELAVQVRGSTPPLDLDELDRLLEIMAVDTNEADDLAEVAEDPSALLESLDELAGSQLQRQETTHARVSVQDMGRRMQTEAGWNLRNRKSNTFTPRVASLLHSLATGDKKPQQKKEALATYLREKAFEKAGGANQGRGQKDKMTEFLNESIEAEGVSRNALKRKQMGWKEHPGEKIILEPTYDRSKFSNYSGKQFTIRLTGAQVSKTKHGCFEAWYRRKEEERERHAAEMQGMFHS